MDEVLSGPKWKACLVYLDVVVVHGRTFEEYCERLESLLMAFDRIGLSLNPAKCLFAVEEILCLGHRVTSTGSQLDSSKVAAIQDYPSSSTCPLHQLVTAVRSFLEVVSYHRRFVNHFAILALPLYKCLKKNAQWIWEKEQEEAFQKLRTIILL